jgi:hypothetical protein
MNLTRSGNQAQPTVWMERICADRKQITIGVARTFGVLALAVWNDKGMQKQYFWMHPKHLGKIKIYTACDFMMNA